MLHSELAARFGIERPRIAVLGLNPHAGEGGHLGREEIEIIGPVLDALRAEGLTLEGPMPADTAFTPAALNRSDAVLAMYHDQGLPVLKHAGFGHAVNVTLGLPTVRTSVDHGTALDLAGLGQGRRRQPRCRARDGDRAGGKAVSARPPHPTLSPIGGEGWIPAPSPLWGEGWGEGQ